jgi:hypothetical protein
MTTQSALLKLFSHLIAESCVEGDREFQERVKSDERLAARLAAEEAQNEKKVSRFEGDIDLRGQDEADAAAEEEKLEEGSAEEAATPTTPAV